MIQNDSVIFGLTQKQFQRLEGAIRLCSSIEKVIIFGSGATGKSQASPDIGLSAFGNRLNCTTINRLASPLDDLPLAMRFDIRNYDSSKNYYLKNKINSQGKLFFERKLNTVL